MDKLKYLLVSVYVVAIIAIIAEAQTLHKKNRYCFRYSWLGPKYDNESNFANATCDDVTLLSNNVPCRHPLVVTYDGSYPDNDYLWENYDTQVSCLLTDGEVCASYTHLFNGYIQNVTYLCTKVVEEDGRAMESGCLKSSDGNREVEVCVCRSYPGVEKPCNSSPSFKTTPVIFISVIIGVICKQIFQTI